MPLWVWPLWVPHLSGITWYLWLGDWLISLTIMSLRFIPVMVWGRLSQLLNAESYFVEWINHILFIRSAIDGHWVALTFCLLWIMLLWTLVCNYLFETEILHNFRARALYLHFALGSASSGAGLWWRLHDQWARASRWGLIGQARGEREDCIQRVSMNPPKGQRWTRLKETLMPFL